MPALKKEAILLCCVALTFLGCATNGEYRRQTQETYYQALQATDPQRNETLQPGSEKEREAIERLTFLLAHFTEDNIKKYIRDVYAPNAYYRDPITAKQGVEDIETYYIQGTKSMHELGFDLLDVAVHDGNYYFRWTTQVSLKSKEDDVINLPGISHVRFDKEGRVIFEQDYWDAGVVYERLPIIGYFIRWLKKKA